MNNPWGQEFRSKYREEIVAVDNKVRLKVMIFEPLHSTGNKPILFVAGWVSSIRGWASLIRELAKKHPIYYLETREKRSAVIAEENTLTDEDFSIVQCANDIICVCNHFGINAPTTIACGSSLGATAIIEAMKHSNLASGVAFLVGPNTEFAAPAYLSWILHLPLCFFPPLKDFVIWYLRSFRVDAKKEPEQMQRYEETIKTADPKRLKHSARAAILQKYTIWGAIETVNAPIAIAYASSDKLHSHDNIRELAHRLPQGELIPCLSNLYMHSAALAADIEAFLKRLATE